MPAVASISANAIGLSAYSKATRELNTSLERLSTGKRINRASDDPTGLISATGLKVREKELNTRLGVIDQQTSRFGAIDGAASVLSDLAISLQSKVIEAANTAGQSEPEREAAQIEVDSILDTIDFLSNNSTFKGELIIKDQNTGTLGSWNIAATDADGNPTTKAVSLKDLRSGGKLSLSKGNLETAQNVVKAAADSLTSLRSSTGNAINALQSQQRGALTELENVSAARSQIEDTDYAAETGSLIRSQTQQQAALFVTQFYQRQQADQTLALLRPLTNTAA